MSRSSFRLEGNLQANLAGMKDKHKQAMVLSARYVATQSESFMRSNAPWTDRTGNARSGLRAKVVSSGDKVAIVLHHSVPYGPYLEVRFGGKYGIIPAAMAAAGPLWVEVLGRMLFDD